MWKLFNKLFDWQYARIRKGGAIYITRMRYFGYNKWYGKFPYLNTVRLDLDKWEVSGDHVDDIYPLTDKLTDKRPKQKGEVVYLKAVK
jgi:hypothetical protein